MKLNALIVDDEHSGRASLKILLNKDFYYLFEKITTVATLQDAIKITAKESFQVCFLDIELNTHSGFELLPHLSSDTKIVFVTAYSEYAIQAIKGKAFDYLLKPINPIELKNCINRYEKEIWGGVKKYLHIKELGDTVPVRFEDIEYLQANGPYSKIYLTNQKEYITAKTLKTLTEFLGQDFIRIHKSYIVNKMMVKSFNKESLTTIHNTCLPVSRIGAKELSEHF